MDDDDRMSVSSGSSDTYEPSEPAEGPSQATAPSPKFSLEEGLALSLEQQSQLEGGGTVTVNLVRCNADVLPIEIWQYIFSYLPPPTLGLLETVSKRFKSCFDGSTPAKEQSRPGRLKTVDAEALWATWRITHPEEAANMPKPLDGNTERDMWKLVRGIRCDSCGKLDDQPHKPTSPDVWRGGPTMSTTRAVWPFALRLCGECLFRCCEKDTALLCTPARQFRPALPYAFLTHDFNYVPTTILKEAGQAPSGLHISKQFYKGHVEQILQEWERILSLGHAAAEEWLKGLAGMGNRTMTDAARWEHWENKGGLNRVLFAFTQLGPAPLIHPTPTPGWAPNMLGWQVQSVPPQHQQFAQAPGMPPDPLPQQSSVPATNTAFSQPPLYSAQMPVQPPIPQPPPPGNSMSYPQQRMERNPRDATEAKAARRQQIEQRCLSEVNPPIPPNVLRHMSAFQAAIQIGFPLNDAAWESLIPKLLEQREAAEQTELEHTAQLLALQHQVEAQGRRQANGKENREALDKEWEEALRPQRERLSVIADDYVRHHWKSGQSVNSGNVARFAMAVFDHVRKTFYTEVETADTIAITTGLPRAPDPEDGPFLRRLTLETMKWVYDHKIRPLTRDYGKEIFFCNGPGCEMTNKHFAFEGVIQHYGAKHTNDFSKGNVIVHWQTAEWPEELPFFDPGSGPMRPSYHRNGGYSRGTTISPQVTSGLPFNVPSIATSPFGASPFSDYKSGPYTPPVGNGNPLYAAQGEQHGYGTGQASPGSYVSGQPGALQSFDPTDLSQFFKAGGTGIPNPTSSTPAAEKGSSDQLSAILAALKAKSVQPLAQPAPLPLEGLQDDTKPSILDSDIPDFEVYQEQLRVVAETARSAWNGTNAVHGMPTSVRVFAVIQYTVLQFSLRFNSQISIGTFTAALMNSPILDPLKQADDLLCCQCQRGGSEEPIATPVTGSTNIMTLLSHFQNTHSKIGGQFGDDSVSWPRDLIALPPSEAISDLIRAPGITDEKLVFLSEAFPEDLPRRIPRHKDAKDHGDHRSGKKNKRSGRKVSNGRRADLEDPNLADSEGSGRNGFRSSNSPGEVHEDRWRRSRSGEDDDAQYDPSKPALGPEAGLHKKRRDYGRKTSGLGTDLAKLLAAATEQSNQAAAEENRRRGILSEPQPKLSHAQGRPEYQPQPPRVGSRPSSAPKPPQVFVHGQDPGDRLLVAYGDYPGADHRYDQSGSRHARFVREGQPDQYAIGTPPSAGRKSRYARYDEQHELMLRERTRSRSPTRYDDQATAERPHQVRQREYLAPERLPPHYHYPDEPEPIYIDQYGHPVRLVRIDDAGRPPPGHAISLRSPGEVEYIERRPIQAPRYYEVPPDPRHDPRYDPRSTSYASQQMPEQDIRYVD